jgi:DNA-binding NtrC family response regulator
VAERLSVALEDRRLHLEVKTLKMIVERASLPVLDGASLQLVQAPLPARESHLAAEYHEYVCHLAIGYEDSRVDGEGEASAREQFLRLSTRKQREELIRTVWQEKMKGEGWTGAQVAKHLGIELRTLHKYLTCLKLRSPRSLERQSLGKEA